MLVSPNLSFQIRNRQTSRVYKFFLSSDFERNQWIEAIKTMQKTGRTPATPTNYTMLELQTWITACRAFLKTNMGSYLLRSGEDERLLVGDLHVHIFELTGFDSGKKNQRKNVHIILFRVFFFSGIVCDSGG